MNRYTAMLCLILLLLGLTTGFNTTTETDIGTYHPDHSFSDLNNEASETVELLFDFVETTVERICHTIQMNPHKKVLDFNPALHSRDKLFIALHTIRR